MLNGSISDNLTPVDIKNILDGLDIKINGKLRDDGWGTVHSPLREEKKPSFSINVQTGAWKDHGTGDKGDIVNLVAKMLKFDISQAAKWIKDTTGFSNATPTNYYPAAKKTGKEFWSGDRPSLIKTGQKKLQESPDHPLVETAVTFDYLRHEILIGFDCGIIHQWDKEWLAFPYPTGCQLYRRETQENSRSEKIIISFSGSKPGDSFFGPDMTGNATRLIIAKSPRECMLLTQLFGEHADVIGLCSGEVAELSREQIELLKKRLSQKMYTAIYTILDCDTDKAHKVASGFCHSVHEVAIEINPLCEVKYVNVHHETEETYKDVTDAIRAGMQVEELEKLLANAQSIESINSINSISNYENELDLESAPRIPDAVYDDLPDTLKLLCELIEHAFQRDVFLIAALPVYASVMTNVEAAHVDGTYTPDIYTMIIANPGTGKGIASKAKKLGDALNDSLGKERIPIPKDSLQNGILITEINQRKKSLFIPANSSSRAFYNSLQANGECGLIFETEIDTLLNASKQDWGNFSDIIRKAFHHESISINRKNESFSIVCPRLSICITGTFGQFRSMFKSADDGYYSRYAFFTVNAPREWQSHRPTKNSKTLDKSIGEESKRLEKMYRCLQSRGTPLTIDLSDEQFDMIDTIFSSKMHLIDEFNLSEYLQATNKRLAVIAFRLACLFTVLRSYDKDPNNLSTVEELVPSEKDMNAAIALAETFFEHAIRLFQMLPKSSGTNRKGEKFKNFIDALPDTFKTSEAIEIGKVFDLPESSVKRWLSNTPELERIEHGTYRKVR